METSGDEVGGLTAAFNYAVIALSVINLNRSVR